MFWGLNLKPNRKYSQTTEKAFHISQAALDTESSPGGPNQIFISIENQRFLLCTLKKGSCEQVMLDLNFSEGNDICFQSVGSGNVTLSGYVMEDVSDELMNDDTDGEEDAESTSETEGIDLRHKLLNAKKANKNGNKGKSAAKATEEEEDEDDDSDQDSENEDDDLELDGDEEEEEEEEEDEDFEEEDDDSEDEELQQPKPKQAKLEKPEKQQNGVAKQKDQKSEKKSKKELKKEKQSQQQKQEQTDKQPKTGGERVLSGGVKIVDLRVGNGPEAKAGKRTQVYYEGRLLSNNKVFDSLKSGAGFKFSLGRGEVIKGWDVGVIGMKVGGKRRITCPPHMGYGARGSPPTIPPNSTLVFEVELKSVN